MARVFQSVCLKVFLMLVGSIIVVYMIDLYLINYVGKNELRNIYIDRISAINGKWNGNSSSENNQKELKKEILSSLEVADEKNVQIFFMSFDEKSPARSEQNFLPRMESGTFIESLPLTINFPLIANAIISFQDQHWIATRMIAHDGVILTLVNSRVIDHRMEDFLELRSRVLKRIYPILLALALIAAFFIAYAVVQQIRRI